MAKKVKNINGTSDNSCRCGSWLRHWEIFSGKKAGTCSEVSCNSNATLGAHVQDSGRFDNKWYIIPLCNSHNALKGQEISISDYTTLVSANTGETCARR